MISNELNISLIQTSLFWEDKKSNLDSFEKKIQRITSSQPDIVVLPEMFSTGFTMNSASLAETNSGETMQRVVSWSKKYDIAILFTGDSDFLSLVTYLRARGKKVYIFSSKNNVSEELRTGGDGYFDVLTIEKDIWGRELKRRPK